MNRKGDIALTITLVLTLILLVAGLVAFVTDNRNFGEQSKQIARVYNTLNFNEDYLKSEINLIATATISSNTPDSDLKDKFKELALKNDLGLTFETNFFAKIKNNDFRFEKIDTGYEFEITNVLINSKIGNNQVVRKLDYYNKFQLT